MIPLKRVQQNPFHGGIVMPGTIDTHGLSQEEIETVRRFADFLREKARNEHQKPDHAEEDVERIFAPHSPSSKRSVGWS